MLSRTVSRMLAGSLLILPVLALSGCGPSDRTGTAATSGPAGHSSASAGHAPSTPAVAGPKVTTNARDDLPIDAELTVSAPMGKLVSVTAISAYGVASGTLDAAGTTWTSNAEWVPNASYHLLATATNSAGGTTSLDRTFSTGDAPRVLSADVTPWGDATVGIGQPIIVRLSSSVSGAAGRAAVERALLVSADKDFGPASWHWVSSTEVHFRPKEFWPAHTTVQVAVNLVGVRGAKGLWGKQNRVVTFQIGRSFVMRISDATHLMTVTVDGRHVRNIPVSMGRPGYQTRSGIKTIMSHQQTVRMTSASYGGKDVYDEIVHYAQRLTWSGEFVHSAPWSVYAQGHRNVSHGCVNISPSNAIWLFGQTNIGDPVITTGTGRQMEPGNGDGGDWALTWSSWTAGSALH